MEENLKKDDKIFITGHNGLVGNAILKELLKNKYKNIFTVEKKELDLRNQDSVQNFISKLKPDVVILAAAKVGGILNNSSNPVDFLYDNLMIQNNVIMNAFKSNVKKLLYLGSSCIYPKFPKIPITEDQLLTGPLEETNEAYAIAKIAGLKLCNYLNSKFDTSYRCLMPTNLYGENDNFNQKNGHVIPSLISKFYDAEKNNLDKIIIWGDGTPKREFMYVDDLANACLYLMRINDEKFFFGNKNNFTHLNVGVGYDITIEELVKTISSFFNIKGHIIYDKSVPNGTPRKLLNIEKITSLGWKSKTSLKEGLEKTIKSFREKNN